jgi:NAD dependent epimerase/dehydratase family enzyme
VLGRPAILPAPAAALRLLLGERSALLLGSLRVRSRLDDQIRHRELELVLRQLLDR